MAVTMLAPTENSVPQAASAGQLQQRRVPVDQQLEALAGQQLAAVVVPLGVLRATAGPGQLQLLVQGRDGGQLALPVGQVAVAGGVHRRAQDGHQTSSGLRPGGLRDPAGRPVSRMAMLTAIHLARQEAILGL